MTASFAAMMALSALAAPLSAQPTEPAMPAMGPVDQAIHCAAVRTFSATMVAQAVLPDRELEEKIRKSITRWIEYAASRSIGTRDEVLERYSTESEALAAEITSKGFDEAAYRARMQASSQACNAAERAIFGNSINEL